MLKSQMEGLKVEDRLTQNDIIHTENFRHGGSTKRQLMDKVGVACVWHVIVT